MRLPASSRLIEAALWTVAALCITVSVATAVEAHAARQAAQVIEPAPVESSPPPVVAGEDAKPVVMGRLEIQQIALSVPVLSNFDPDSLTRGVGHIPGTAVPGGLGNLGLAGHRDTFFRPLRNVKLGMKIDIITHGGDFRYMIDSTEIVTPDQVRVLDIGDRPEMTLITCYPFDYIGAAPRRFIVHAHLLSVDPS